MENGTTKVILWLIDWLTEMNFGEGKNDGIPWLTHSITKTRNLEGGNKKGIPWLAETISEEGTAKNTATHKLARKDEFRRRAQQRDTTAHQQARAGSNDTWESITESFKDAAKEGPTHWCWCCDRLWFSFSLTKLHKSALKAKGLRDAFLSTVFAFEDSESGEFCGTYARHIMVGSVP